MAMALEEAKIAEAHDEVPIGAVIVHHAVTLVDHNAVVPVVERLEPVVVELKVPVLALRDSGFDDECFVRRELPVAMVVANVWIAACPI